MLTRQRLGVTVAKLRYLRIDIGNAPPMRAQAPLVSLFYKRVQPAVTP
jgi:hypothetical protein